MVSQKSLRKIGISKVAVAAFEFELDKLVPLSATTFSYTPLPKFPEVEFDLAMLFDVAVPWERIRDAAQKADSKVKSVRFIDEYQGEQIPTGKRSVALQMIFADAEKTLTSEETHQIAAKVVAALEKRVGATARAK